MTVTRHRRAEAIGGHPAWRTPHVRGPGPVEHPPTSWIATAPDDWSNPWSRPAGNAPDRDFVQWPGAAAQTEDSSSEQAVGDQAAHGGQDPGRQRGPVLARSARPRRRPIAPSGSSPSQAPTTAASAVSARTERLQAAALAEQDHRGSSAPGRPCRSSVTSPATPRRVRQQLGVGPAQQPALGGQHGRHRARPCASAVGPSMLLDPPDAAGPDRPDRPAQGHDPEADRLDLPGGEVGQPGCVHRVDPRSGCWPPSRTQVSAYSAGSWTSRCTTQPSSPDSSSQPPTRSDPAARPRRCSQLPSSWAVPPGASTAPTCVDQPAHELVAGQAAVPVGRTTARPACRGRDDERRVADAPGRTARPRRARAGCPGAGRGSGRRTGHRRRAFRPAFSAAIRRQRAEVSVPTTAPACGPACRACTPQPVPMSSAAADRRPRIVQRARVAEAPADAEHVVRRQRAAGGQLAEVGDQPPVGRAARRPRRRAAARRSGPDVVLRRRPGRLDQPERPAPADPSAGSAAASRRRGTGSPSNESRVSAASGSSQATARRPARPAAPARGRGPPGRPARAGRHGVDGPAAPGRRAAGRRRSRSRPTARWFSLPTGIAVSAATGAGSASRRRRLARRRTARRVARPRRRRSRSTAALRDRRPRATMTTTATQRDAVAQRRRWRCSPIVSCTMAGAISTETRFITLISGLIAGPAVSLNGSPTVSPMTVAAWASEPLPP